MHRFSWLLLPDGNPPALPLRYGVAALVLVLWGTAYAAISIYAGVDGAWLAVLLMAGAMLSAVALDRVIEMRWKNRVVPTAHGETEGTLFIFDAGDVRVRVTSLEVDAEDMQLHQVDLVRGTPTLKSSLTDNEDSRSLTPDASPLQELLIAQPAR